MNHNPKTQSLVHPVKQYPIQSSVNSSSPNGSGRVDEHTLNEIANNLYKYNVLSILRRIEANEYFPKRLLGETSTPKQEPVRLKQTPSLSFCTKNVESIRPSANGLQIVINEIGLLGANSPLPLHLVEFIFQRKHQYGDSAWCDFVNMLQHRLITLFYRSWKNAQSVITLDNRLHDDKFSKYLSSLVGFSGVDRKGEGNYVDYYSKLYFMGYYLQRNQSANNLECLLTQYFNIPIKIEENIGTWYTLPDEERTRLGKYMQYSLKDRVILGKKIYDTQTKFRIQIGPLALDEYESFFKGKENSKRLMEWVELYVGQEYEWDVQLILAKHSVPKFDLKRQRRLGLTTWLGRVDQDAEDVIINYKK